MRAGPGRPRRSEPRRPGATTRDQILDAAAELFTTNGFARTTTREIAQAVAVRQATLYHHFATKEEILQTLLVDSLTPSLRIAAALATDQSTDAVDAAARLHALAHFDGRTLCDWTWNLGALFLLPEVRTEQFAELRSARERLRRRYIESADRLARAADVPSVGDLAFRLVESLINMRWDGVATSQSPLQVANACLRMAGWQCDDDVLRLSARLLEAALPPSRS